MIPNPIPRVLSSIERHRVRALLMGGQACVFYGAAEFSRDVDLAILASDANLGRLRAALDELRAEVIAVPPFEARYLRRGHAVHFRCREGETAGLRVDVMTRMRGVDAFPALWARRTTLELTGGARCHLMGLPDLVRSKKTQRDKDWPMLRRLVEGHYLAHHRRPTPAQVDFWLAELRTPGLLVEACGCWPGRARKLATGRPLLALVRRGDEQALPGALAEEERAERAADAAYWKPLRAELEALRRARVRRR